MGGVNYKGIPCPPPLCLCACFQLYESQPFLIKCGQQFSKKNAPFNKMITGQNN